MINKHRARVKKAMLVASMIGCFTFSVEALAEKGRKSLDTVALLSLPRAANPIPAADGSIYYQHIEADWAQDKHIRHLWRWKAGEKPVQMLNSPGGETGVKVSPDGKYIAFPAKRGANEHAQIYVLTISGGEAVAVSRHPTAVSDLEWAPNSSGVYFIASDSTQARDQERKKRKDDIIRFDADRSHKHLWFQPLKGPVAHKVTNGDYSVSEYSVSIEGRYLLIQKDPTPYLNDFNAIELHLIDVQEQKSRALTRNDYLESSAELRKDNKELIFIARATPDGADYVNANLFTLDLTDDQATPLLHMTDQNFEVLGAHYAKNGKSIYFLANHGLRNVLYRYDPKSRKVTKIFSPEKATITNWTYDPTIDRHSFKMPTHANPGELYWMRGKGGKPRAITRLYEDFATTYKVPKVEAVTFKGEDGEAIEALLTYPVDYDGSKRVPLIIQTHGGPASSDQWGRFSSFRNIESFASKGYAILQPNYRGSTGYGDRFLRDMIAANGGYFNQAHKDIMAGADHMIAMGLADPERLIKKGWSAGGHMTNKIITYTNRFKAASSGAGAINWFSMVGQSDVRDLRLAWFGKFPHQQGVDIDLYLKNSPLFDIHKVTTPTLILVGEKDVRVPMPQSQELYNALKANGVPTAFYIAPGEPHGWRRLSHRLFKTNVEQAWFAQHVLKEEYKEEASPLAENGRTAPNIDVTKALSLN